MSTTRPTMLAALLFSTLLVAPGTGFAGDAPFSAQQVVALSADEPRSIASGDIDGDGDADLVSASTADDKLAWYANLGNGSFDVEHVIASGLHFTAAVVFDADGDGDLDVLGGIDGPEPPRWYENTDGAGTFSLGQVISVAPGETTVLAVADVDRDGDPDVLGASASALPEIRVYANSGDGSFPASELVGVGAVFAALVAADLDHDGDLDIVSGGEQIAGVASALAWWENLGGAWTLRGIGLLDQVDALGAADLDRDGWLDVIIAGIGTVSWFRNDHAVGVSFPPDASFLFDGAGEAFTSVQAADLDGDGDPDVIAASGDGILWFANAGGGGSFASATSVSTHVEGPTELAVVDVDNDGDLDLLSASADDDRLAVYKNRKIHRSALFFTEQVIDPGVYASCVAAADLNLDGTPDLVYSDVDSGALYWTPNLGGFSSPVDFSTIDDVSSIDVADFEGHGSPDVVSGAWAEGRVAWHPNDDGSGPSGYQSITEPFFEAYRSVRAADVDGDGDQDVVTGSDLDYFESPSEANVVWWENDGTPGAFPDWQAHAVGSVVGTAESVVALDLDRDGDQDVIVGSASEGGASGQLVWFRNDGGGVFALPAIAASPGAVHSVATGDLDGDGDPDVVSIVGSAITWNANELPDTSWPEGLITADVAGGRSVVTADLDHDGDLDVVSGSADDGKYAWYENLDGAGAFGGQQVIVAYAGLPSQLITADVDRDGDPDVVGASVGDGKLAGQLALYDNAGGQFRLETADLAPATSFEGQLVPLLAISMAVNSRPGDAVGELATLALGFDTGGDTQTVQFDLTPVFNADVIVNDGNGGVLDPTQDPVDLGYYSSDNFAFMTQSVAATYCAGASGGIPDDGFFPANAEHPDVQLAYDNADDGNNAFRSALVADSFSFAVVPVGRYFEVHLFATTGDGSTYIRVTLLYQDGSSQDAYFLVPDWFNDPLPGAGYYLVDGMDRINRGVPPGTPFGCEDSNNPAIFGFPIAADPDKTLVSVQVQRLDSSGVLNVFGATGVRPDSSVLDSGAANALIEELRLYRDKNGTGQFEDGADTLVQTFDTLDLDAGGLQTLELPDGNGDLVVASPARFLLVAQLTPNASAQSPHAFRVIHLAGNSTAENAETDATLVAEPPVDLQYAFSSTETTVQPAYAVDSNGDEPDGIPGDTICATVSAACTLRAAIQEANARPGDDLILVPAELGPYVLTAGASEDAGATGDLDIIGNGSLTIRGTGPERPVIDADGLDRVFDLQDNATAVLERLTITGGDAQGEAGGGIRTGTNAGLIVDRCEITGNTALDGGGVLGGTNASVEIVDSTIATNTASSSGGGISILATALALHGSTIVKNEALAGGGLYTVQGVWTVGNTTISGNLTSGPASAAIDGGGPGSTVVSTTVTDNSGGGIAGSPSLAVGNSIVAANDVDLRGAGTSLGHNLIGDLGDATGFVDGVAGDQVGVGGTPIVPFLAPLADNGGGTLTHTPLAGSPAIDTGNCAGQTLDQRGEARAVDLPGVEGEIGGDGCDIGAYEIQFGSVLVPLEIPVRWCAVAGAPSVVDPTLVGAATVSDVLRQRTDRATEKILRPRAGIVLRSGATQDVGSFPVLADPQAIGQPGDVFVDPATANFDEFLQLITDCRAAWEALDPTVVGITAVNINRFVDESGNPLPILGLGGRAGQNNAAEQLAAGRVMVVDSSYELDVDPFDSLLAHEAAHALSLEHGNGKDDDQPPDDIIDNDDDKVAGLPKFDGPNLMQYRKGTELSQGQVERARTHAFVTIPDSKINLAGVLTDAGTIDPGMIKILDFGFIKILDFSIDDIQDLGMIKILDFGMIKILDFDLSQVLDFGMIKILDFGFCKILDFGMVYGSEGVAGTATIVSTTSGVFWPSPIRPDQTLMYRLDVDDDPSTGGDPAAYGFPGDGIAMGIDLIMQVHISSSCTADVCTDEQTATVFRFIDADTGYVEDPDAVLEAPKINETTVGLVVDNGGEDLQIDDQKIAAIVTTTLKSGVLVEAGAQIGKPVRLETLSFVDCSKDLPGTAAGGGSPISLDCQCHDCAVCPDYPGCQERGTPDTVPDLLQVDSVIGTVTFDDPALPTCEAVPGVVHPGASVTVLATHFTADKPLQISVDGQVISFDPPSTVIAIPADSTAASVEFTVELADPANPEDKAQVAKCSVIVNANVSGVDGDQDGCDDYSVVPAPGDPSNDGADFDGDGLCDTGDPDDDDDGVADALDQSPQNRFVCGSSDADSCDDCSSSVFDPSNDGDDFEGDGLCDAGDPDDDNDGVDDLLDAASNDPYVCGDTADHDGCDDCSSGTPDPSNDGPDADLDGVCDAGDTCTDLDHDGLGNGDLGNAGCVIAQKDHDDSSSSVCADLNHNGCDDCSSGVFDPAEDGTDIDQDGLCDVADNCPTVANAHQSDYDFDGLGNECDDCTDRDHDGFGTGPFPPNTCPKDNCSWIFNPGQEDVDDNGIGDLCEKKLTTKPTPAVLWPPNHRMVDVDVQITSDIPAEYLSIVLVGAASDERDNGRSDGDTMDDIQDVELGQADLHVRLRAERTGLGQGRHYALIYDVTNMLTGEMTQAVVEVSVPLEQGGLTEPLSLVLFPQDGATVVKWKSVSGAKRYDVIRGDLASLRESPDHMDLGPVICIASELEANDTSGFSDAELPQAGQTFFYLVQYYDGWDDSSYGTESSAKPLIPAAGACE